MHPLDRALSRLSGRALIALFILAAVFIALGFVLNRLEEADRRGEGAGRQDHCRTHDGEVLLAADGSWRCVPVEGR